jgi:hypothetical protein
MFDEESFLPLLKYGKLDKYAELAYERISDELIDEFGVSNEFKAIIKQRIKIEQMYYQQVIRNDKSNQLLINVEEKELEDMKQGIGKTNIMKAVVNLEKTMGFKIDFQTFTTYQFYYYMKVLSE